MLTPMSLTIAASAHQEFVGRRTLGVARRLSKRIRCVLIEWCGVEIEIIAQGINRSATFLNVGFTSIDQSIERGDAEIGVGGIEDTQGRRATMAPTVPYYRFREVLSVRDTDPSRFRSLADLRGVENRANALLHELWVGRRSGCDRARFGCRSAAAAAG